MEKFVLIDGNNIFFRSFYALPQLSNSHGEISNAVFGFTHTLIRVIEKYKPEYIAVAFDTSEPTFRHKLYTEYKGTRDECPSELISQFPIMKKMLTAMNIKYIEIPGIEADDIIGTLSQKFETENIIVSADKDLLQLIDKNTVVYSPKNAKVEPVIYDKKTLFSEMGVTPSQIVDLKALMGDTSDNIPGVKGIGPKTAVDMLSRFETLDGVYNNLDKLTESQRTKLISDKDNAYMSYTLATIKRNVEIDLTLDDFRYDFPFSSEVRELFVRYEFNSLLKRDELFSTETHEKIAADICEQVSIIGPSDLEKLVYDIKNSKEISLYINNNILEVYVNDKEYSNSSNFALPIDNIIKDIISSTSEDKILYVFDLKGLMHTLDALSVDSKLDCKIYDLMLLRYLYNTNAKAITTFSSIAYEESSGELVPAYTIYKLSKKYIELVENNNLMSLYNDIELPLSYVLYDMEIAGFKVDLNVLAALKSNYEGRLENLTNEIYTLAGMKFNINSSKQLSDVLFENLGIQYKSRTKKVSTNHDVLESIKDLHPIVPKILEYREVYKLYSTYIVALSDFIHDDGKIHTVFNQALTTTGRLSSSDPNLQNIPIRTEEGKNIRKLFVPSTPGGCIVSADYSQIELRLLAHMSGDEGLIESYKRGDDIHTATASNIFGVKYSEVTPNMRRDAKAINFGIVYGISDYGLSQNIGSSVIRAREYIEKYFTEHPKVKEYMNSNVEYCKEHGFVKTMFGRMRVIPEIKSSNYNLRQFGERAAMNMPLQGTASDIIKIAMINVAKEIKNQNLKSKVVVQVHDELVVDVVAGERDKIIDILKSCMENVVQLKVPLPVNVAYGDDWFALKD